MDFERSAVEDVRTPDDMVAIVDGPDSGTATVGGGTFVSGGSSLPQAAPRRTIEMVGRMFQPQRRLPRTITRRGHPADRVIEYTFRLSRRVHSSAARLGGDCTPKRASPSRATKVSTSYFIG